MLALAELNQQLASKGAEPEAAVECGAPAASPGESIPDSDYAKLMEAAANITAS